MRTLILTVVALLLAMGATGANETKGRGHQPGIGISQAQAGGLPAQSLPLSYHLISLGRRYHVFFTLEEAYSDKYGRDYIGGKRSNSGEQAADLHSELERLARLIPHFTYQADKLNPRIIHIIDSRLEWLNGGYGVAMVLDSIDFTGKVNELPDAIGQLGIPIFNGRLQSTGETRDNYTVVHVKGKDLGVRQALSDFVPLEGRGQRGGILWIATTKLAGGEKTYVYYPWPGDSNTSSK